MPKTPQLAPFHTKEQLYDLPLEVLASHPIFKGEPSHPTVILSMNITNRTRFHRPFLRIIPLKVFLLLPM